MADHDHRPQGGRRPGERHDPLRGSHRMGRHLAVGRPRPKRGGAVASRSIFWRIPWLRTAILLAPPLTWFVAIYLTSLALLLVTAFWTIDPFTTRVVQSWSLDNFQQIVNEPTYLRIIGRTVLMAALVTMTDA